MELSGHFPSLAALEERRTSYAFQKWNHDISVIQAVAWSLYKYQVCYSCSYRIIRTILTF
jgi:hypothetical protein